MPHDSPLAYWYGTCLLVGLIGSSDHQIIKLSSFHLFVDSVFSFICRWRYSQHYLAHIVSDDNAARSGASKHSHAWQKNLTLKYKPFFKLTLVVTFSKLYEQMSLFFHVIYPFNLDFLSVMSRVGKNIDMWKWRPYSTSKFFWSTAWHPRGIQRQAHARLLILLHHFRPLRSPLRQDVVNISIFFFDRYYS